MVDATVILRGVRSGSMHVEQGEIREGGAKSWELVVKIGSQEIVLGFGTTLGVDFGLNSIHFEGSDKEPVVFRSPDPLPEPKLSMETKIDRGALVRLIDAIAVPRHRDLEHPGEATSAS